MRTVNSPIDDARGLPERPPHRGDHPIAARIDLRLEHRRRRIGDEAGADPLDRRRRSEEHTSELQSHVNLVCRLLLEKKKKNKNLSTQQQVFYNMAKIVMQIQTACHYFSNEQIK